MSFDKTGKDVVMEYANQGYDLENFKSLEQIIGESLEAAFYAGKEEGLNEAAQYIERTIRPRDGQKVIASAVREIGNDE